MALRAPASVFPPPFRSAFMRPHLRCSVSFFLLSSSSAYRLTLPAAVTALPRCGQTSCSTAAFAAASFGERRQIARQRFASTQIQAAAAMILESPSAERNKEPIWDVLSKNVIPHLPDGNVPIRVLEVAAGCGVHTLHFVSSFLCEGGEHAKRGIQWYPTDPDIQSRGSIDARVTALPTDSPMRLAIKPAAALTFGDPGAAGIQDGIVTRHVDCDDERGGAENPTLQDVLGEAQNGEIDLIICINMIHISPWSATLGLMSCASAALRPGGVLYCYGPYKVAGTAVESNLNFDRSLRTRDPSWGVRDLEEVVKVASENGLVLVQTVEMPANNLSVIFRKS